MTIKYLIDDISNIGVTIYVIGYEKEGESIIFLLENQNNILYSAVIDCFSIECLNKTIDILKEHEVNKLNLICWSHPDDDHTVGLEEVLDLFAGEDTKILFPYGVWLDEIKTLRVKYSKSAREIFKFIEHLHEGRQINHNHNTVGVNEEQYLPIQDYAFIDKFGRKVLFSIKALSPIFSIINHYIAKDPNNVCKNIFSIALSFNIGNRIFLFTSDIEDCTIKYMDDDALNNVFFLKTPHHTSSSSSLLYQKIALKNIYIPISVTTVYEKHKLPDIKVISQFSNIFRHFYSTRFLSQEFCKDHFGYVEYKANLLDKDYIQKIPQQIQLKGNAVKII